MSREKLEDLRAAVGQASRTYQAAVDALDAAAADCLGINRTDLRCLDVLMRDDTTTPSALARELRLTSGSVTAMLDRLEGLEYVSRSPDPGDRRKVVVRATPMAARKAWEIYGPIATDGAETLAHHTASQLKTVIDFLSRGRTLYEEHLARVRSLPSARRR